jgi:hypothetical protein
MNCDTVEGKDCSMFFEEPYILEVPVNLLLSSSSLLSECKTCSINCVYVYIYI